MFENDARGNFVRRLNDESPVLVDSNVLCSPGNNTSIDTSNNKMKVNSVVPNKNTTTKKTTACTNNYNNNNLCMKIQMPIIVFLFLYFSSTIIFSNICLFLIHFYKHIVYTSNWFSVIYKLTNYAHRNYLFEECHSR